ncbi:TPA: ethanolamine utilization ethanol dehydrogenase EutG [Escherichia coli]|nr:ethanolamine utilization ethanol dehydrogenase EutG [Escherichia coli]
MAHDEQWLTPRLQTAATLCNQTPAATESPLWLGVDLGTCDVVSMVVDRDGQPVAVCLDWADVVRDGIVWDFFGAVTIVRRHLDTLEQQFGLRFSHAATSFPPGTDPRISINVLESAGLEVSHVLDEPTAVADLLQLDNAGVVDIGGGTTGIAIVKKGKVTYSADEATGGHHISLTLAGNRRISLEEAEQYKRGHGDEIWPAVKPVYEKMADIVARHIEGQGITDLWLAGGSCMQPGVAELFRKQFPALLVTNPDSTLAEMSETSVLQPRLPLIAIPTTAGTGSETTNVTVIIDAVSGRKQVLAHASLMPDVAILDAALTEGVPSHVTAMTGIDALTHAIEAYSALNATPFTDSLAIGAIAMIGKSLPKAVGYGHDLAARESMLLASCMAGMAFSSAGLGLCHAMAHQPGAALHIPHGLANAMLLPTVMEFNRMVCRERFSQIGRALRTKKSDDHDAINAVSELIAEVGIGKRLGDVGATSAHYGAWAQAAQEDICLRSNPRTASLEQIVGLYAAAQ